MDEISFPDARWRANFRRRLLTWFNKHARDLPWRRTRDPYAVWVSEIMLQQTQVLAVKPYFERFLAELPDVEALAAADEQFVLRLWEGLGYYRRARQMHTAAGVIAEEHGGVFPRDVETLQSLPGIGRYTAGAIASIAFDGRAPIVEANTQRLFSRLLAYRGDPTSTAGQKELWSLAENLLPAKETGRFNQALMELGALVCTPKSPTCQQCPAMSLCPTFAQNLQDKIPAPKKRTQYEDIHEAAVIVRHRGKILLRRCASDERWAGLWDFPRVALESASNSEHREELRSKIEARIGLPIELGDLLTTLRHGVTRYRITLSCYAAKCTRGSHQKPDLAHDTLRWLRPKELNALPLSTTGRKLVEFVRVVSK